MATGDRSCVRINKSDISGPVRLEHRPHVNYDANTSGFRGVARQWLKLIEMNDVNSNLTPLKILKHHVVSVPRNQHSYVDNGRQISKKSEEKRPEYSHLKSHQHGSHYGLNTSSKAIYDIYEQKSTLGSKIINHGAEMHTGYSTIPTRGRLKSTLMRSTTHKLDSAERMFRPNDPILSRSTSAHPILMGSSTIPPIVHKDLEMRASQKTLNMPPPDSSQTHLSNRLKHLPSHKIQFDPPNRNHSSPVHHQLHHRSQRNSKSELLSEQQGHSCESSRTKEGLHPRAQPSNNNFNSSHYCDKGDDRPAKDMFSSRKQHPFKLRYSSLRTPGEFNLTGNNEEFIDDIHSQLPYHIAKGLNRTILSKKNMMDKNNVKACNTDFGVSCNDHDPNSSRARRVGLTSTNNVNGIIETYSSVFTNLLNPRINTNLKYPQMIMENNKLKRISQSRKDKSQPKLSLLTHSNKNTRLRVDDLDVYDQAIKLNVYNVKEDTSGSHLKKSNTDVYLHYPKGDRSRTREWSSPPNSRRIMATSTINNRSTSNFNLNNNSGNNKHDEYEDGYVNNMTKLSRSNSSGLYGISGWSNLKKNQQHTHYSSRNVKQNIHRRNLHMSDDHLRDNTVETDAQHNHVNPVTDSLEQQYKSHKLSRKHLQSHLLTERAHHTYRSYTNEQFRNALAQVVTPGDPRADLKELRHIGEGSTGVVYLMVHKPTQYLVAVKKMDIFKQQRRELLFNEVIIMQMYPHPNIVETFGSYLIGNELWVAMEYLEGGALTNIITRTLMSEQQIATICRDVLKALAFLHDHGIIHRDIKSDSILLSIKGVVKLSDFGFCAQVTSEVPRRRSLVGTPYWMSPEVINRSPYNTSVDVWSMGVLLIEMVDGEPSFFNEPPLHAMRRIQRSAIPYLKNPNQSSRELNSFLNLMLIRDPMRRATAAQLLLDRFLLFAGSPECLLPLLTYLK